MFVFLRDRRPSSNASGAFAGNFHAVIAHAPLLIEANNQHHHHHQQQQPMQQQPMRELSLCQFSSALGFCRRVHINLRKVGILKVISNCRQRQYEPCGNVRICHNGGREVKIINSKGMELIDFGCRLND